MTKITKVDRAGTLFVANWEGFRAVAYDDLNPKKELKKGDTVKGLLTIGYGTTRYEDGSRVKIGDTISKEKALQLLDKQIAQHCADFVKKVTYPLNQNQFNALASFSYNCGKSAISNNKKMLESLNKGDFVDAMNRLMNYKYSKGIVLQGLINRRTKERDLFLTKVFVETPIKETPKPTTPAKEVPKPTTKKYTVVTSVKGFKSSSDAKNNKNAVSTVKAATYFVFNEANGMINVSTKEKAAGTWINPTQNVKKAVVDTSVKYKIQKGDTLSSIATKYKTTVKELQKINSMGTSTTIIAGKQLIIKK